MAKGEVAARWVALWWGLCACLAVGPAAGGTPNQPTGTLVKRTYTSVIDGAKIDYATWLPPGYEERRSWPMIVFLHGSKQGSDWEAPTRAGASVPVMGSLPDLPFVVVFPLMRGSWSISALAERDVIDTIADAQAHLAVDPDRTHLVGVSLGGFAAWRIACRYPQLFASLTTFCSGGEPDLAVNLRNVAVRVFHGAKDPLVAVDHSRDMVDALRKAGIPVDYSEYPDKAHVVWQEVLGNRLLYKWMSEQVRVGQPRRLSLRTYGLRYGSVYWAAIESAVDPSRPAYVDVFVPPDEGLVLVYAENVGRLVLNPPGEFIPAGEPVRFVEADRAVEAARTERGWVLSLDDAPADGALRKVPGVSGPIQDVLNDPFVVSVASRGGAAAVRRWHAAAAQGLWWTRRMVTSGIQVVAADQVTPQAAGEAHLICFGDVSSHPLLGQLNGRLPLHARGGRVYLDGEPLSPWVTAFVMIYPNPLAPERYIVVCSGGSQAVGRLAALVLAPPYLNPPPVEDLVLLGGDGQIIPWGREASAEEAANRRMAARMPGRGPVFDSNWQLTPQVRAWLRSIGGSDDASDGANGSRPGG